MYSAEVWGLNRLEHLEKIHMIACKRFLGVPGRTPNKMVYGDLARYPLYVNSYVASVRYWFKLLKMDSKRIPYKAYKMLLEMDTSGKNCWVSKIREILCCCGFNIVWLQQGVGNVKTFLGAFRQRLVDMFIQEWSGTIRDRERYSSYRTFKTIFEKEKYIIDIEMYSWHVAISQVRFNVLPLNCNLHRYSAFDYKRMCPFCRTKPENESHFLFECTVYNDLREKFLQASAGLSAQELLKANDSIHMHNLSRYIFHAINKRKRILLL